jgi:hypothetical protein
MFNIFLTVFFATLRPSRAWAYAPIGYLISIALAASSAIFGAPAAPGPRRRWSRPS